MGKIKNYHVVIFISSAILLSNMESVLGGYSLLSAFIVLLIRGVPNILNLMDFNIMDLVISSVSIVILPLMAFYGRKSVLLNDRLTPLSLSLILISFILIFSPLLSPFHPDMQRDLGVTRLLNPLTSKLAVFLKYDNGSDELAGFFSSRNSLINISTDPKIVIADSIRINDEGVIYFQNAKSDFLVRGDVLYEDDEPKVATFRYLLGTDEFGRDVLSRLVYGARISILIALGSVLISLLLGTSLGFAASFSPRMIDIIINRIGEAFLAFPIIILVILLLSLFGNNIMTLIIVLGFVGWIPLFKIVKSEILDIKSKSFFLTAAKLGLTSRELLIKEILPVIRIPIVVYMVFQFANVILAEAALSYLGLGAGLSHPTWGSMINSGQEYIFSAWWLIFFPGLALVSVLITVNAFGKKLNYHFKPGNR